MNVLISGGGSYVGGHIYVALHNAGYRPFIIDSFSQTSLCVLQGLRRLLGRPIHHDIGNLQDTIWLRDVVRRLKPVCTIHLGKPEKDHTTLTPRLREVQGRIDNLISLTRVLDDENCRVMQLVSSSAVYPVDLTCLAREHHALPPQHIDSHDKMLEEELLRGFCELRPDWTVGILRHFHVLGAHPSGCLGEPSTPNATSLMYRLVGASRSDSPPLLLQSFDGLTPDGSAIKDFIHVQDVAEAHVKAVDALMQYGESFTVNIGTGKAQSVLDLIRTIERISGRAIDCSFDDLQGSEPSHCVADTELCAQLLSWRAQLSLDIACADAWRWHIGQPPGYPASA